MNLTLIKIKYLLNIVRNFFSCIFWYEIINNKKISKSKCSLIVIKSKKQFYKLNINKKIIIKKNKLNRFKKNIYLLLLAKNEQILSSGWVFFGKKWKVTEMNININLKKKLHLLFDFETPKKFRNKGNYTLLLKLIKNKFKKKRLAIYTLSYNFKSRRGIESAGFKLTKKIYS